MPKSGRIVLKPRRARPFFARHPWVYSTSVQRVEGDPAAGAEVEVYSHEGQFIARGLYNPASLLCTRLYRWDLGPLDSAFWLGRLEEAVRLRTETLGLGMGAKESAYRVVFSEGDGLSGLTVDRYGPWLSAHFSSLALYQRRDLLLGHLLVLTGAQGVLARPDKAVAAQEGLSRQDVHRIGSLSDGPVTVVENEIEYQIELDSGQKTGFYCDQRANRLAVAAYAEGRRVLDLFCFSGGFSFNALRHGKAVSTLGIDSSAPAIFQARRNAELNRFESAQFETGDVLKTLARLRERCERFDVVVCDPPKSAHHARDLEPALQGYRRLNLAAVEMVRPGGILATCCCSGVVQRRHFSEMIAHVSEESGRPVQILEPRGQGPDHPVSASCLESEYLKCLICRVGSGSEHVP